MRLLKIIVNLYDAYVINRIYSKSIIPNNRNKKLINLFYQNYLKMTYEEYSAVKNNPYRIKNISNPSIEMQMMAVKNAGDAIEYIENPSLEIIELALNNTKEAKKFINKSHLTESELNYLKLKYDL